MSDRVYGTWLAPNGIRHFSSGTPATGTKKQGRWDTYVECGNYIGQKPKRGGVVTCLRCLYKRYRLRNPYDYLRGLNADLVSVDEAQDINAFIYLDAAGS